MSTSSPSSQGRHGDRGPGKALGTVGAIRNRQRAGRERRDQVIDQAIGELAPVVWWASRRRAPHSENPGPATNRTPAPKSPSATAPRARGDSSEAHTERRRAQRDPRGPQQRGHVDEAGNQDCSWDMAKLHGPDHVAHAVGEGCRTRVTAHSLEELTSISGPGPL